MGLKIQGKAIIPKFQVDNMGWRMEGWVRGKNGQTSKFDREIDANKGGAGSVKKG